MRSFSALAFSACIVSSFGLAAPAAADRLVWNGVPDPHGIYGLCNPGSSAIRSKALHVYDVGESLVDVLAVTVLDCRPYGSGGGTSKVECPAGSPYAYCTRNFNDGGGNDITLGVLKADAAGDPNAPYTGCPAGATPRPKIELMASARMDPRGLKGIVTLGCAAATQPTAGAVVPVACPPLPHPYSTCLATPNDGYGNAVTIGIVSVRNESDAYGLYGECEGKNDRRGIRAGFSPKASLVSAVGLSMTDVRGVDLLLCGSPGGMNLSKPLQAGACSGVPQPTGTFMAWAGRYDYCIWGIDGRGNGVIAGVFGG